MDAAKGSTERPLLALPIGTPGGPKRTRNDGDPSLLLGLPPDLKDLVVASLGGGDVATLCALLDALSRVSQDLNDTNEDRQLVLSIFRELRRLHVLNVPEAELEDMTASDLRGLLLQRCHEWVDDTSATIVLAEWKAIFEQLYPEPQVEEDYIGSGNEVEPYGMLGEEEWEEWEEFREYFNDGEGRAKLVRAVSHARRNGARGAELRAVMEEVMQAGRTPPPSPYDGPL
jgi:hypothetical protein